jgi:hypothetical protein
LTFDGTNLYVGGNITVGGTTAFLAVNELKVKDKDIILGITTDAFGNDISTDTTANSGGIAIASTVGTPLISMNSGGEITPDTYKQIMWFKSGDFTGLGTDAWIFNYGVGIGSTQIPYGVRLAAGGMQVTDTTITSPQLSISGISTFTNGPVNIGGVIKYTNNNIRIGDDNTGCSITSGINNFFAGSEAGRYNTTGCRNNFFGQFSGCSNTTGCQNNFFGYSSGRDNTSGRNNNFLGYYAGRYNTYGCNNNFLGQFAGRCNTTGSYNNFFGSCAGRYNTTGCFNNILGSFSGPNNTTGTHNNFFGYNVAESNTTGSYNNFFGHRSGLQNSNGCHNNFFGKASGMFSNGCYNNFFGYCSASNQQSGNRNIAIGYDVKLPIITGSDQLVIGSNTNSWISGNSNFNVGIGTTNPTEKLWVNGNISINGTTSYGSTTATTETTSQIGIHSGISSSTYRSVEYTIQASQGTNFHATKILTIHNGTTAYNSEYGTIYNNVSVGAFDIDLSEGNIRLLVTPASSSFTSYTINFVATKI